MKTLAEVSLSDRELWKWLLDADKSKCNFIDTCDPATEELQRIARHRQSSEGELVRVLRDARNNLANALASAFAISLESAEKLPSVVCIDAALSRQGGDDEKQ